jgi:outer membrane protein TolC
LSIFRLEANVLKQFLTLGLCIFVSTIQGVELAELQGSLLTQHPLFLSSNKRAAAYLESARVVSALPDPEVKIGLSPAELVTRNGPIQSRLGFFQRIPNPVQRRWKRKDMESRASIESARENQLRYQFIRELKESFFEYWYLSKSLIIVEENLELSRNWTDLIKTHYSFHNYLYPTLLSLQVETLKLEDQVKSLESRRTILSDQIQTLAWLPGDEVLPWPTWNRDVEEPPQLEELDISRNPELLVLESKIDSGQAHIHLAKSEDNLSYQLGVEWTRIGSESFGSDPGKDALMLSAGVQIPLQRKAARAKVRSSELRKQALAHERDALHRTLMTKQQEYMVTLVDNIREILLIETKLLPRVGEAMTSLKGTYQTGDIDYFSLLENLRLSLNLNLSLAKHQKSYWQTLARLEELCGTSLFEETADLTP